jgi:beta-glucosidase
VSVLLENTGPVDGVEVAQLYIRDPVASVTRPVRQLKKFQRVALKSQTSIKLIFSIQWQDLSFFNGSSWLVEAGIIEIYVGGSSDARLGGQIQLVTS